MNQEYLYTKSAASNLGRIFCKNIEILKIGLIGKIRSNKILLPSPTCLDKLNDSILISCAANSKLRQPDLLAVPVVEQLQPVHHLVHIALVVPGVIVCS